MKQYSTIFLDWSKTLSHSRFWGHWQNIDHSHNHIFKHIQSTLFGLSSDRVNNWMRGKYTTEQIIEYVAEHTQSNYGLLLNEFIKSCQQMEYSSPRIPELVKQLQAKGTKVVIATDNMDSFTRWTVPALKLDILFDDILNSYALKALKTDTDEVGESLFFKRGISQNYDSKCSILIDDSIGIEPIIRNSAIDFLHVTQDRQLEKHLEKLLHS